MVDRCVPARSGLVLVARRSDLATGNMMLSGVDQALSSTREDRHGRRRPRADQVLRQPVERVAFFLAVVGRPTSSAGRGLARGNPLRHLRAAGVDRRGQDRPHGDGRRACASVGCGRRLRRSGFDKRARRGRGRSSRRVCPPAMACVARFDHVVSRATCSSPAAIAADVPRHRLRRAAGSGSQPASLGPGDRTRRRSVPTSCAIKQRRDGHGGRGRTSRRPDGAGRP